MPTFNVKRKFIECPTERDVLALGDEFSIPDSGSAYVTHIPGLDVWLLEIEWEEDIPDELQ